MLYLFQFLSDLKSTIFTNLKSMKISLANRRFLIKIYFFSIQPEPLGTFIPHEKSSHGRHMGQTSTGIPSLRCMTRFSVMLQLQKINKSNPDKNISALHPLPLNPLRYIESTPDEKFLYTHLLLEMNTQNVKNLKSLKICFDLCKISI